MKVNPFSSIAYFNQDYGAFVDDDDVLQDDCNYVLQDDCNCKPEKYCTIFTFSSFFFNF